MKKAVFVGMMCALIAAPAVAEIISFVDPLTGVDDTTGWSVDSTVMQLGQSYSLLGGNATVTGYQDGAPTDLSHLFARGLGIWDTGAVPVEIDEVDNLSGPEEIDIVFNGTYAVNSIEVRSLFNSDADHPNTNWLGQPTPPEQAAIDFYLGGSLLHTEYLLGEDFLGNDGESPDGLADGDASVSYATAYVVDKLVFHVPTSADLGLEIPMGAMDPYLFTDFAVAGLDVTQVSAPVPAPGALLLGAFGLGVMGLKPRKRA